MLRQLFVIGMVLVAGALSGCVTSGVGAPVSNREFQSFPEQKKTQSPPQQKKARFYRVRRGDTLYSIAWRNDLEYRELARWNGVQSPEYPIFPGQLLRLASPQKRPVVEKKIPPPVAAAPRKAAPTRSPQAKVKPARRPETPTTPPVQVRSTSKTGNSRANLKISWRWPTQGKVVQTFQPRDANRKGIKIRGKLGQPVAAAASGKVVYSGSGLVGYGNLIIVKHNKNYLSAYGYNRKLLVREGDQVEAGERIAELGVPNRGAEPVLYFEIRKKGKPVNPLSILSRR